MTSQTKTLIAVYNPRRGTDARTAQRISLQLAAIQAAAKALYGQEIEFIEADPSEADPFARLNQPGHERAQAQTELSTDERDAITQRLAASTLIQAAQHAEARAIEQRQAQAEQPADRWASLMAKTVDDEYRRRQAEHGRAAAKARRQAADTARGTEGEI